MPYYFWMKTCMKQANNFQKAKVQLKGVRFCLFFSYFRLVLIIKKRVSIEVLKGFVNSRSNHRSCSIKIGVIKKFDKFTVSFLIKLQSTSERLLLYTSMHIISLSIFYFSLEYLWLHGLYAWKLPNDCLLNSLSVSRYLMICAT